MFLGPIKVTSVFQQVPQLLLTTPWFVVAVMNNTIGLEDLKRAVLHIKPKWACFAENNMKITHMHMRHICRSTFREFKAGLLCCRINLSSHGMNEHSSYFLFNMHLSLNRSHCLAFGSGCVLSIISCQRTVPVSKDLMALNKSSNTVLAVFWSQAATSEIFVTRVALSQAKAHGESECRSGTSRWAKPSPAFIKILA